MTVQALADTALRAAIVITITLTLVAVAALATSWYDQHR